MSVLLELPGLGPKSVAALEQQGICTPNDLLMHLPYRYDDVRNAKPVSAVLLQENIGRRVVVKARVHSQRFFRRGRRRWLDVRFHDQGQELHVRWFQAFPSLAKSYQVGTDCVLSGVLRSRANQFEMANPERVRQGEGIIPRYRDIRGVRPSAVRKAIAHLVQEQNPTDWLPKSLETGVPGLRDSFRMLHLPPKDLDEATTEELNKKVSPWHRRLVFQELLRMACVVEIRKKRFAQGRASSCPQTTDISGVFPFSLTNAQKRVSQEISHDLAQETPMSRLLQGDVGAGKTVLAFLAAYQTIKAGHQAVFMAPTEVLIEQHFSGLNQWAQELGLKTAVLTASTDGRVRRSLLPLIAQGQVDFIFGTHSVLSDEVNFKSLGLAIIDEQHRFGVGQRVRLREKGERIPHLLVMTATPIPRTLALTAYGDLEISVLDEKPPGRQYIETTSIPIDESPARVKAVIREALEQETKVFVVCPLVDAEETVKQGASVVRTTAYLRKNFDADNVWFVHGRMPAVERRDVMEAFRQSDAGVLVATTVIEVGIDIPKATDIIIMDADRFGLAQLHQLRGRVGRGKLKSRCLLVESRSPTDDGLSRLQVMCETNDGFQIAEEDLEIRGPGDLLGIRQAGLPSFLFGTMDAHFELVKRAKEIAQEILGKDPTLEKPSHKGLADRIEESHGNVFAEEGG